MRARLSFAMVAATLSLGANRSARSENVGVSLAPQSQDACSLLDQGTVSGALEVPSATGKRVVESSPKACIWSDDPNHGVANRRVTLSLISLNSFNVGKAGSERIKTEPVTGIGDEAYYEIFGSESPVLVVRKGSSAFTLRILNGLKFKAFTSDAVRAKETQLAKAAAGKL